MEKLRGRVWKYGPNINTDVIIPGRYCHITDPRELAKYCMADLDAEFVDKIKPGDIVVAGGNFGCGSSREVAPLSIKASGISAVVAPSFARIFYRNAINLGLPVVVCKEARRITQGDRIVVDVEGGAVQLPVAGVRLPADALTGHILDLIQAGGLVPYLERKLHPG